MLEIKNISFSYNSKFVLNNISFNVGAGCFCGILGPNGSGKTTLLKVLSGITTPLHGRITLQGKTLSHFSRREIAHRIAVVPQNTETNFDFTAYETVLMGRTPHIETLRGERERDYNAVERAMNITDTLSLGKRRMSQLSGGERQRVIIARALAQEPKLLLLDEPTTHLDIKHQMQIFDILKTLNREYNLTAIVVLHDLNLAAQYCDNLIMLDKGNVVAEGDAHSLLDEDLILTVYGVDVEIARLPRSGYIHILPLAFGKMGKDTGK